MKKILFGLALFISFSVVAAEGCYQVSLNDTAWSRTPELLCIERNNSEINSYEITLKSGLPFRQKTFATFNYSLLESARCLDCNADVYGVAGPSNSTFNGLGIEFNGSINRVNGDESGTVKIGETELYYRKL